MMGMGLTSENDSSLRTDAAKLFYCAEMPSYDALGVSRQLWRKRRDLRQGEAAGERVR
jgi:hypothetical protein